MNLSKSIVFIFILIIGLQFVFSPFAQSSDENTQAMPSYRIDGSSWSPPLPNTILDVNSLGLPGGQHFFEIKAIDQQGAESRVKKKI